MTDYVDLNGESIPVEAWKYVVENDGVGLDKYTALQYGSSDKETLKRVVEKDDDHTATDFEALVSIEDVRKVVEK